MRGYFGHGEDKSDGINDDIKEGFDLALDLPATDPIVQSGMPFYGPNVWPVCLPRFKPVLSTFYRHMLMLGMDLLDAFSISLGVARDCFTDCFQNPIAQIRLLRYPPPVLAKQMRIGAGEHTDFGWLTMIMQDETGGLEVLNNGGSWIPAPALPNSFLINTGDLMQRWTNDEYPATIHRVINRTKYPRYSTAFFMDPDYHTTVSCLPNCTSPNEKPHYEPIMVGEYMKTRFMETTTFRDNETQSSCV
jgi:isopenicillin N synthase-like dioxygenase